jgi:hypothetical protein
MIEILRIFASLQVTAHTANGMPFSHIVKYASSNNAIDRPGKAL